MSAVPPDLFRKNAKSLYTGMLLELLFVIGLFPLCLSARGQSSLKAIYHDYWVSVIAINEAIVHHCQGHCQLK